MDIGTEYAGRDARFRLTNRWLAVLDACRAVWGYLPLDGGRGLGLTVHGVRQWPAGMQGDIIVRFDKPDRPSARPELLLSGFPEGPSPLLALMEGWGRDSLAVLSAPGAEPMSAIPGVDADGRFALFGADRASMARLDAEATRAAYAAVPRTPTARPLDGLSGPELEAVRAIAEDGHAPVGRVPFDEGFLSATGLMVAVRHGAFALVVSDKHAFAPYRAAVMEARRRDLERAAPESPETAVVRAILASRHRRATPDGFIYRDDMPSGVDPKALGLVTKRLDAGARPDGGRIRRPAWIPAPSGEGRRRWLAAVEATTRRIA